MSEDREESGRQDQSRKKRKTARAAASFIVTGVLLVLLIVVSVNIGSLKVSPSELFRGLFIKRIDDVAAIYDLRFPRIVISLFAGAAVAVSGVLFQAVLKNPLADPGIIGISGGAVFAAVLITAFLPVLYFFTPLFAFAGGVLAFFSGIQSVVERRIKPASHHPDRCCGKRHVHRSFRCPECNERRNFLRCGIHCGREYHSENMGRCTNPSPLCNYRACPFTFVYKDVQPDVSGRQDSQKSWCQRKSDSDSGFSGCGASGQYLYSGRGSCQLPGAYRTSYRAAACRERPPGTGTIFHAGRCIYLSACGYHRPDRGSTLRSVGVHYNERDRRSVLYHFVKEVKEICSLIQNRGNRPWKCVICFFPTGKTKS